MYIDWKTISHQELELMIRTTEFPFINAAMKSHDSLTPLCLACKYNREDLVTVLLWHGAKADQESAHRGMQPLHYACELQEGNVGVVRKLLQAGASVNEKDMFGSTGLHSACSRNNLPVVELLCQSGANVNIASTDETPLVIACMHGHTDVIRVLLSHGGDPNACEGQAMDMAILTRSLPCIDLLVKGGICLQQPKYLIQACEMNNFKMLEVLLNHGINPNQYDKDGRTPLQAACLHHNTDVRCVQVLLKHGARVNPESSWGTPLFYAALSLSVHKVRVLLAYGVDANTSGESGLLCEIMPLSDDGCLLVTRRYIVVFRLLVAAGLRMTLSELHELKKHIVNAEESRLKDVLKKMIKQCHREPLSLQCLCRIAIRSNVNSMVDKNVKTFPLPGHVIKYLNFSDIADESVYEKFKA